jgi:hypothetical protein
MYMRALAGNSSRVECTAQHGRAKLEQAYGAEAAAVCTSTPQATDEAVTLEVMLQTLPGQRPARSVTVTLAASAMTGWLPHRHTWQAQLGQEIHPHLP